MILSNPLIIIRRALEDARGYRFNFPDDGDRALIREYESVMFAIDRDEIAVIPVSVKTSVSPDGTLILSMADFWTVISALSDGADYRANAGDPGMMSRYRNLARILGDDR
jgi:hypothetical protein